METEIFERVSDLLGSEGGIVTKAERVIKIIIDLADEAITASEAFDQLEAIDPTCELFPRAWDSVNYALTFEDYEL